MTPLSTLTVSQYSTYIKQIFDAEELLHNIKIVGEVFGVSKTRNVLYFSLKDEASSISCVCFSSFVFDSIQEGAKLVVTGSPNYYVKGGRLSFVVSKAEKFGRGELYLQFLMMKEKLEKEGLFDPSKKKPMPASVKTIGVITSKEGAVIHDICSVSWRRDPSINIALYPVKVQGKGAEEEIARAIEALSDFDQIDVIIVARGGGSMEDLAAYNTERVARAAFECHKPLISAVGHETDFTIIDFVSDLRAPTPSAAAELLTSETGKKRLQLKSATVAFTNAFDRLVRSSELSFESAKNSFIMASDSLVKDHEYELGLLEKTLSSLDPKAVLKRGYAKIEQNGKVVDNAKAVVLSSKIEIAFYDGRVIAQPEEVKND